MPCFLFAARNNPVKPGIYNYTDFRRFLYEYIRAIKAGDGSRTHRLIAAEIGIKSAGHLTLILQGKANISRDLEEKIATWCRFKKRERAYFHAMVAFNQATSHAVKRRSFEKLIAFPKSCVNRVGAHQYKYYDKWYHSVIRALLEFVPVDDDGGRLGRLLVPSIRPHQARCSLELLCELGMARKDEHGFYRPVQQSIDTGSEVPSVAVNAFILEMLDKARRAMDRFERSERNFSWITVGVSDEGYRRIVEEMRAFRLRVAEIVKESRAERVYQINMQAFPVTGKPRGRQ